MTHEELIARLRQDDTDFWHCEAADRIEALVAVRREDALELLAANARAEKAEARAERLEAVLREILEKPRNADLTYAELFAEVVSEARAALKGDDHE